MQPGFHAIFQVIKGWSNFDLLKINMAPGLEVETRRHITREKQTNKYGVDRALQHNLLHMYPFLFFMLT